MTEKMIKVFVAFDGCEFIDASLCRRHEQIQRIKNLLDDLCVSESGSENDEARSQAAALIVDRWLGLERIMNEGIER